MSGVEKELRKLPGVDRLLHHPALEPLRAEHGARAVADAIRALLDQWRARVRAGESTPPPEAWPELVAQHLARHGRPLLRPAINATGVIVHTNLGRAPLSPQALDAVAQVARGYSNLEYDLESGTRGSRHVHAQTLLRELTGAEDALVVNNNAAAVYLVLAGLCQGREVIISRGQLVEIGGGFRIPDVLRQSGARLVEVGTTNRTHLRDYTAAIGPETAAIMRVHASNFRQIGFVIAPALEELVALARQASPPSGERILVIDDLGSGTLIDTRDFGLAPEPTVQESLAAGADLVTFSGDKLLGGPQAGIVLGRTPLIERLRRHPMARALRVDKMTLAALEATLQAYRRGRALEEIPVWRMIAASPQELRRRAARWRRWLARHQIAAVLLPGESAVGGGSLPGETLPTTLLALESPEPEALAARLRQADPPVIARIRQDRLLLDPRTVLPEQERDLLAQLRRVCTDSP